MIRKSSFQCSNTMTAKDMKLNGMKNLQKSCTKLRNYACDFSNNNSTCRSYTGVFGICTKFCNVRKRIQQDYADLVEAVNQLKTWFTQCKKSVNNYDELGLVKETSVTQSHLVYFF